MTSPGTGVVAGRDDDLRSQHSKRQAMRYEKNGPQAIGKSRGGWNTKIHMVAADARTAITFSLSPGNDHDASHGPCWKRWVPCRKAFHC